MDKDSKQVVVLLTHPNIKESRANKALMDAISAVSYTHLDVYKRQRLFNIEVYECIGNIRFLQISSEFYGLLSEIRGNKYGVGIFLRVNIIKKKINPV